MNKIAWQAQRISRREWLIGAVGSVSGALLLSCDSSSTSSTCFLHHDAERSTGEGQ